MGERPLSELLKEKAREIASLRERLETAIREEERRREAIAALIQAARTVFKGESFPQAARTLFDHCRSLTGAPSGYVALLSADGSENEVVFLEAGGIPCSVDPKLPMPIRGLRAEAYRHGRAVYENDFPASPWMEFMPSGHAALKNVLFAPLKVDGRTVGILGLANKEGDFDDEDARIAEGFGDLAAAALEHARRLDGSQAAGREKESVIRELTAALARAGSFPRLLPVCVDCGRAREPGGEWKALDAAQAGQAGLEISHGLCPECLKIHFPGYGK